VVLVALGGCHLLDGLVACDSVEACEKLVWCSGGGFVRGIVLIPWGSRRATQVERVIKLPSLVRLVLPVPDVWAWRVMPISCRTTG
jgi:hypothetical protein